MLISSNWVGAQPTNYDYMRDPYQLRWKHIDQFYGQVNTEAVTTYNFKYYFYDDYYTYTADRLYQIDSYSVDAQEGVNCYAYQHTKSSIV